MSRRKQTIIIRIIFIIGLSLVLYPIIGNVVNKIYNYWEIAKYNDLVEQVGAETDSEELSTYEKMFQEAREFNSMITGEPQVYEEDDPIYQTYLETLDISGGMMGYLNIDKIGVRLGIYHGTEDSTLQKAVGHLEGTHLPTGDIGNSTVITGHTGLPSADLLTDLDQLEIGDTFELAILDQIFTYEVFEINVVEPYEVDAVAPREGIDMVTLVTCTPYGINSHRLLVHGKQIETQEGTGEKIQKENDTFGMIYILTILATIIVVVLIIIILVGNYRWEKKQKQRMQKIGKE